MLTTDLIEPFMAACKEGNIQYLMNLNKPSNKAMLTELIVYENYKGFLLACENGFVDIVDWTIRFIKSVSDPDLVLVDEAVIPIFEKNDCLAFRLALANKHIDVAARLLEEEFLFSDCLYIIETSNDFIRFIWQSYLKDVIYEIFAKACETSLNSVRNMLEILPEGGHYLLYEYDDIHINDRWIIKERSAFRAACANGNLDILKLLWCSLDYSVKQKITKSIIPSCFIAASKNKHPHILEYLLSVLSSTEQLTCLSHEYYNTFVYAADGGDEKTVELVWKYLPKKLRYFALSASNFAAYRLAYKNQHVHICLLLESFACTEEVLKHMKEARNKGVK